MGAVNSASGSAAASTADACPRSFLDRHGFWIAPAVYLLTRVVVFFVAYTAPQHRDRPDGPEWWSHQPLMRWDGGSYAAIAIGGYPPGPPVPSTVAFFPAYPLLTRPLTRILHPHDALVVVSNVAGFAAILFLYAWARRRAGAAALWCVILISAWPAAFFLSAAYADSVLLLCVAASLWLLDRGRTMSAAAVTAVATATRPTGLALAVVVSAWAAIDALRRREPRRRLPRVALVGLLSVGGLIAHQAYLWHRYGTAGAFFRSQAEWKVRSGASHPWLRAVTFQPVVNGSLRPIKYLVRGQFHRLDEPETWNPLLNAAIVAIGVAGLVRSGGIPRVLFLLPLGVFLMAYSLDPVGGTRLISIARYQLAGVPSFLLASLWASRPAGRGPAAIVALAMMALQIHYVRGFVDWQFVG